MMKKFNHLESFQMGRIGLAVAVAIIMAGCASTPAPVEQMAVSRTAVNAASSAGANEFAPLQLKSAMDKMGDAEHAMTEKNYVQARQLAEQAQVDAQLAEAKARSAKAQQAADALQEGSRVLRQEIDRKAE
ncbi:MAG: DUF4398 domain-containing protein [Gallionella sp.]